MNEDPTNEPAVVIGAGLNDLRAGTPADEAHLVAVDLTSLGSIGKMVDDLRIPGADQTIVQIARALSGCGPSSWSMSRKPVEAGASADASCCVMSVY